MKLFSLLYHDVVHASRPDASGFPGGAAARYKLDWATFDEHLAALAEATDAPPVRVDRVSGTAPTEWLLTFDDGGASARLVGERLAELGWPAHFFVTVDYLGTESFVNADDVLALVRLGHRIGSHSCSHPDHMARAPWDRLVDEWARSTEALSDLVGEPVTLASVPAGSYAPVVARAAAAAGIATLFTSEPQASIRDVHGCRVFGRFTIRHSTSSRTAARLATGAPLPRASQLVAWRGKKLVKRVAGPAYERGRRRLFA